MRILSCLFIFLLLIVSPVFSAPAYGPHMPEKNQFHLGGQVYSVQNRDLQGENGSISSRQHFLLISYGVFDWLSLDLKGGVGNINHVPELQQEQNYNSFMGGGYGFRLRLYENDLDKIIFGFQHISVHPFSRIIDDIKHKAIIDDWQLSWLGSHQFKYATPYVGGKWSRMDLIHWVDGYRNRIKPENNIGALVGVDVPLQDNIWLNLEAQFVDVEAYAGSINFHF